LNPAPLRISESRIGDIEGQIRWRWRRETERRPEIFSYAEVVVPHHSEKHLIGTPGWELKYGMGLARGFDWGYFDRAAGGRVRPGLYQPFSISASTPSSICAGSPPSWRLYAGIEGTQDELSLIEEIRWHVRPNVFICLNKRFWRHLESHGLGARGWCGLLPFLILALMRWLAPRIPPARAVDPDPALHSADRRAIIFGHQHSENGLPALWPHFPFGGPVPRVRHRTLRSRRAGTYGSH
jgi:hypothetical protein